MTTKELIEELQKVPGDTEVRILKRKPYMSNRYYKSRPVLDTIQGGSKPCFIIVSDGKQ